MSAADADALVERAAGFIDEGKLADALGELDQARALYEITGDLDGSARCLHLSATVSRMLGDFGDALARAEKAEAIAAPGSPSRVAAIMEQGEAEILRGAHGVAADHYARALDEGRAAGLLPDHAARLMRKRAMVLAAAKRFDEAAASAREARALHEQSGATGEARRALVELAVVLEQAGDAAAVEATIREGLAVAADAGDAHVTADLELLNAGRAAQRRDFAAALAAARRARTQALAAGAPLSYISAVISIAEVANTMGDRDSAYEALASGWVTAGDAIGEEQARTIFEPQLAKLRDTWGSAAFGTVRDAYNDRRRAVISGRSGDRS
jgi:tetratricopeptide (TPR) repeat protein